MSGKGQARYLRNNSTYPEVKLWNHLKRDQIGYMFKRQWVVDGYIVDFYCSKVKLIVEVDGSVHNRKVHRDEVRDLFLMNRGLTILRIPARWILSDISSVVEHIKGVCDQLSYDQTSDSDTRNASLAREAGKRGTSEPGESSK